MSKIIYKYQLNYAPEQTLQLPADAEVLTLGNQRNGLFIWVLVDPTREKIDRKIRCFPTGEMINVNPGEFLGSAKTFNEDFIWHFFME